MSFIVFLRSSEKLGEMVSGCSDTLFFTIDLQVGLCAPRSVRVRIDRANERLVYHSLTHHTRLIDGERGGGEDGQDVDGAVGEAEAERGIALLRGERIEVGERPACPTLLI
jgi:hypothetical protein